MAPVNGFSSASFKDVAICVVCTFYSGLWDDPGASYCYYACVVGILYCIIAVSCICTLLGAILLIKTDNLSKNLTK